ncbi:hypothetical protein LOK49_Contig419G00001 [Camellia lanceoleosa]|nr:hypothetical protein LOK49_Contig419G00001 [Camellia lanceoleosa]
MKTHTQQKQLLHPLRLDHRHFTTVWLTSTGTHPPRGGGHHYLLHLLALQITSGSWLIHPNQRQVKFMSTAKQNSYTLLLKRNPNRAPVANPVQPMKKETSVDNQLHAARLRLRRSKGFH